MCFLLANHHVLGVFTVVWLGRRFENKLVYKKAVCNEFIDFITHGNGQINDLFAILLH